MSPLSRTTAESAAALARGDLPPRILVPPPGPHSRELCSTLARVEAPGINTLGPADEPSVVWSTALGSNILDVDGNRYVDLTSGFGVAAIGHRHPTVVAAVAAQASRLLHGMGDVAAHPTRVELASRLAALAPVEDPRVYFAVSGADAVEIALKTAVASTRRAKVLVFDPGYHGTTLGALAASSRSEFRSPFSAHLHRHVVRLPYGCRIERIEQALAAGDVAAVLVEPVVGREGVLVPPAGWLAALAAAARADGALFVADEILTGFGRTGRRFALDRERVRPDLLCCGKALGGGLPIAAVVGARRFLESWRTDGEALHTATFVAHPLACAAALATLDVLEDGRLAERAETLGAHLGAALGRLAASSPRVVEARGIGMLRALELDSADAARSFALGCRARGVLVLTGGPARRVVQFAPPLTIDERQLDGALELVAAALADAAADPR